MDKLTVPSTSKAMNIEEFCFAHYHAMRWDLRSVVKDCKARIRKDPSLYTDTDHPQASIDVRLCIDLNEGKGSWIYNIGLVDFDHYHARYCSASTIGLDTCEETLLNELIKGLR